jgi:hypothetical protein
MNVPLTDSACMRDAMTMIHDPRKIDHLRPKRSFTYGTRGNANTAPRLYAADMIPRRAPLGWPKSIIVSCHLNVVADHLQACHCGDICTVLIICESNPEVISMPIHVGSSNMYSRLRLRFRYHGT